MNLRIIQRLDNLENLLNGYRFSRKTFLNGNVFEQIFKELEEIRDRINDIEDKIG